MKILFVTKLNGWLFTGINNSVPARIKAQSKLDEVFWLNMTNAWLNTWVSDSYRFAYGRDYSTAGLADVEELFGRPDLIIFETVYCFAGSKLVDDAIKEKIPYILLPHSQLLKTRHHFGNSEQIKRIINNAAAIQHLNEHTRDNSFAQNVKSFIVPNGVTPREYIKRDWNHETLNAVYIGRIDPYQKGLDLLIKACASIKDKLAAKNFHLNIYGGGHNNETLPAMLDKYQLHDIIKIFPPVFGKEKDNAFKNADMFILTSRFEGMSNSLLEALSYSLPCFVTTGTNMAEEIQSAGAGFAAQINIESIATELLKMIESFPALYESMGKNAHTLSQKYSWDKIAEQSHALYEKLLSAE